MAHMGRPVKNVEAPRPLKSQPLVENNFMLIEELMQLIENVAHSLKTGVNDMESISTLVPNLRVHGPQMETLSKGTLDRAFVVFRNSSQDERLNLMTRLNLLELIELRAKGWEDTGINSYYKTKLADANENQEYVDQSQAVFYGTSPILTGICNDSIGSVNNQQQQLLLQAGEIIRNSGKFSKPTRIPGKTYCKDEIVIKNADSGKVMGIKGRRVHMIEELSETVISFQRVNPGAKERLVQITGPAEDKINFAKQLIEDTIRRNASPLKFTPTTCSGNTGEGGGSCSSLASSNSDEPMLTRVGGSAAGTGTGVSNLQHGKSIHSHQNNKNQMSIINQQRQANASTPLTKAAGGGKSVHITKPISHSYSTSDASLGEYKFTCEVGDRLIKITGDCCDLVRIAKVVLDDYFGSSEFAEAVKNGAVFNNSSVSPISSPSTPITANTKNTLNTYSQSTPLAADSGIGLNYLSSISNNNIHPGDDEVFADGKTLMHNNSLARSRRSHFSRKDSTPEVNSNVENQHKKETARIVHHYEHLLYYAKGPHSWVLPSEWKKICEKFPSIIRNTNLNDESDRFNAEGYLEIIKSSNRRDITNVEETATIDVVGNNLNIE